MRELCPRMAIISNGDLLVEGSPAEALNSLNGTIWSKVAAQPGPVGDWAINPTRTSPAGSSAK